MDTRRIIDAGPTLNFFSIRKERLLLSVLGKISAPETVRDEVLRKAATDPRFAAAATVWGRAEKNYIEVLSDDITPDLAKAVFRLTGLPMAERRRSARDLGETMVISHAVAIAESGADVVVVIDEGEGQRLAALEAHRLDRMRAQGRTVGYLNLVDTPTILERAAGGPHLPDREAMRSVYARLTQCDDGLLPIESTKLLSGKVWGTSHP